MAPDKVVKSENAPQSDSANEAPIDSGTQVFTDGSDDPLDFGQQRMGDAAAVSDTEAVEVDLADPDSLEGLRQKLEAAEAKATENWDRVLRMQADMENQRKRAQKDVSNARKFALESMVGDLLPIRDSLALGLTAASAVDANVKSIRDGSELTLKMIDQAFEKYNIIEINPLDEKFDPELHQAMSMQTAEGVAPNIVTSVMQKGYTLNDRLVRPALVMVSK
ncbi:MAG: nucleotide exchange factor GrpE [Granulosicoccus sp.]